MFSNRLKELRQEKGLIQERFAQELNVSKGAVAMWETGKRIPDSEMLKAIAKFFSVSVDYLLGESKFRNNEELIKYNEDRANWGINDPYFEAAFDLQNFLLLSEKNREFPCQSWEELSVLPKNKCRTLRTEFCP